MSSTKSRPPLTRERIFRAAVALADDIGLDALTMRRLGSELDVEAMSLYKHVANKDEIMDGMVELVLGEIHIPTTDAPWQESMRLRASSARNVLQTHPWAIGLLEDRSSMGPVALRYMDAIIGNLRAAGFDIAMAAHAFWLLDSFVYGQVIQELSLQVGPGESETGTDFATLDPDAYPHLAAMYRHAGTHDYAFDDEFDFGLELLLDGLERTAAAGR